MIVELDKENANRDLTSQVTVLTDTPDASNPMLCQGLVLLGDGVDDLDGTGGDFELTLTVAGRTIQPDPQTVAYSTAIKSGIFSTQFIVPENEEVIMKVKSPNGADVDVDVTAYLYDISAQGSLVLNNLDHLAKAATGSADMTNEVVDNTVLSRILANGNTSDFVPSTDGLQLIRDDLVTHDADIKALPHITVANVLAGIIDATGGGVSLGDAMKSVFAFVRGLATRNKTTGAYDNKDNAGAGTVDSGTISDDGTTVTRTPS